MDYANDLSRQWYDKVAKYAFMLCVFRLHLTKICNALGGQPNERCSVVFTLR